MSPSDVLRLRLHLDVSLISDRVADVLYVSGQRGVHCSISCTGCEGSSIDRPHGVS